MATEILNQKMSEDNGETIIAEKPVTAALDFHKFKEISERLTLAIVPDFQFNYIGNNKPDLVSLDQNFLERCADSFGRCSSYQTRTLSTYP
jgi:hypothetical protein